MSRLIRYALLASLAVASAQKAWAADEAMVLLPSADSITWGEAPPTLPKGSKLTVLAGDPGKPGPFVLRVYFPANAVVGPHTHKTPENLTLISGELYHQMGAKLDRNAGEALKPGGFVYLPAMMPHSVWTKGEITVVQVTGTGPFGVDYLNLADDPSRAK